MKNVLKSRKNVAEFFTLRLKNVLSDNDVRYDIIDAVLENADEVAGTYAKACNSSRNRFWRIK